MEFTDFGTVSWNAYTVYYRKGTEDDKVLSHSFDKDIFFRELPSFRYLKEPVIFDIGAHIGTFSLLAAHRFPDSRIYAFEASRETFEVLNLNVLQNKIENIKAFHKAVAAREGEVLLYHNKKTGNWGHSITAKLSDSSEKVEAVNLSAFIEEERIQKVDLLKMNCEGAEFEILASLTDEQLKRFVRAGIILYHQDLVSAKNQLNLLAERFQNLGFRLKIIRKSSERGWLLVWNRKYYSRMYFFLNAAKRRAINVFN